MPRFVGHEPVEEAVDLVFGQVDDACLRRDGSALVLVSPQSLEGYRLYHPRLCGNRTLKHITVLLGAIFSWIFEDFLAGQPGVIRGNPAGTTGQRPDHV